jgi:hypothetical protein
VYFRSRVPTLRRTSEDGCSGLLWNFISLCHNTLQGILIFTSSNFIQPNPGIAFIHYFPKIEVALTYHLAEAVRRWLPTAAARVQTRVLSCGICDGQSGAGAGFLRVLRFALPIFIPPISLQSPSPIIRGWCNRPVVAACPKSHPGDLKETELNSRLREFYRGKNLGPPRETGMLLSK